MEEITFTAGGAACAAWHLPAQADVLATTAGRPCVVMAHGFGGTRDSGLLAYAEGFAAAGLDVVLFDYRGFGASGGEPRQLVSFRRQRQDYHAAIATARTLPGVDPQRIVLWGTSYSGGHVLPVAAQDGRVAAVISMTPAVDGLAALAQIARYGGPMQLLRATRHGLEDPIDHFDVYDGPGQQRALADQLEFLHRHLACPPRPRSQGDRTCTTASSSEQVQPASSSRAGSRRIPM